MGNERAKLAYETFRSGLRYAPSWVRDAVIVAYLQGTLDQPKGPAGDAGQVGWMGGEFDR